MRPFTLNALRETLNALLLDSGLSDRRTRELIKVAEELGLVDVREGRYTVSELGMRFLNAVEKGDGVFLHSLFYERFEPYRRIYDLVNMGVVKPLDLVNRSGFNSVVVDVVLRLIKEIESIGASSSENMYLVFERELLKRYREMVKKKFSKYILISELLESVRSEMKIPYRVVVRLFEQFVERRRGRVLLTKAPIGKPVEVLGKPYTYVLIEV